MRRKIICLFFGVAVPGLVQAASFDCARARSAVERAICEDAEISQLDSHLGSAYQTTLAKLANHDRREFVEQQREWLHRSRNACTTDVCLKQAYWSRIAAVETYVERRAQRHSLKPDQSAIQSILSAEPLFGSRSTQSQSSCQAMFDALKDMRGVTLVEPSVQALSYEAPAMDRWKRKCGGETPFHLTFECESNLQPRDAREAVSICRVSYGLAPYRLYELPSEEGGGGMRYFFYFDEAYGPMNSSGQRPTIGGGFAGFQQIEIDQCLAAEGNRWPRSGDGDGPWIGTSGDAGQGGRNGENYNNIFAYGGRHFFLILHKKRGNFWLTIEPITTDKTKRSEVCSWSPYKDQ